MPLRYRNPDWTEDNGEPYWLPYGPPNPNYVGPNQLEANMMPPTPGAQRHATPIAGHPVNSRAPSNGRVSYNAGIPSNTPVPFNTVRPRSNGLPPNVDFPMNAGVPVNTGGPSNTGTPNNAGAAQSRTRGPNMPGVPCDPRIHSHSQRQNIRGQPMESFTRHPVTEQPMPPVPPAQRNDDAGHVYGHAITGHPGPRPVNDDAQIEADIAEVKALRNSRRTGSQLINSFEHHNRLERAERRMLRRGGRDLSRDMPQDNAGQRALVDRLCTAITNLEDIESRKERVNPSSKGDKKTTDSAGVKCVKNKSNYEIASLAWKFMVSARPQLITAYSLLVCQD